MEAAAVLSSSYPRHPLRFSSFPSPSLFSPKPLLSQSLCFTSPSAKQQPLYITARKTKSRTVPRSSSSSSNESTVSTSSERWLLKPVGDGDCRHIGFKVPLPSAFEIVSNVVNVGRLPDKADVVIPVATVSGLHARFEKKDGTLLVTDMDSTNGTFINEKRLQPGVVAAVSPGSCVTFGDTNLAIFRVSKIDAAAKNIASEESGIKLEADISTDILETTS